ncbi:MAG: ABC transporter permease [Roseiarcus sp.]|jgi:ribose transport system permease protein
MSAIARAAQRLAIEPALVVVTLLLAGLIGVGAMVSDRFATVGNFLAVLEQAAPLGFVAAGQTLVILEGGIDLSVGAIAAAATVFLAGAVNGRDGLMLPMLAAVLALSALAGLVNGIVTARTKVHPLVVTLGSGSVLNGLVLLYTLQPTGKAPTWFENFAFGRAFGLPISALAMVVGFVLVGWMLRKTRLGRNILAVGGNPEAARLSGIGVDRVTMFVYAASGFFSGLAGVYFVSRMGVGDPRVGDPLTLASITPVIVGGTMLGGGRGGIAGTLVGVLLISVLNNVLNYTSVSTFIQWVVQGLIIIAAVSIFSGGSKRP